MVISKVFVVLFKTSKVLSVKSDVAYPDPVGTVTEKKLYIFHLVIHEKFY
jgi:hypothetical protein